MLLHHDKQDSCCGLKDWYNGYVIQSQTYRAYGWQVVNNPNDAFVQYI